MRVDRRAAVVLQLLRRMPGCDDVQAERPLSFRRPIRIVPKLTGMYF